MACATRAREASFSFGATASSRSRNTMSAGIPGPLPNIFSDDPGIDKQERRGRSRERGDMPCRLDDAASQELGCGCTLRLQIAQHIIDCTVRTHHLRKRRAGNHIEARAPVAVHLQSCEHSLPQHTR